MDSLPLEILLIGILSLLNGCLATAELAIVSANRTRLSTMAGKGSRGAQYALKLSQNSSEFLATVQVGITLIGIVAGVFGGATIAEDFSEVLQAFHVKESLAHSIAYSMVIGIITYFSVVFGELVPKQIALAHPERVAVIFAPLLAKIAALCRPVVWILETSGKIVLYILPMRAAKQMEVSEDDIRVLISQGEEQGEIRPAEKQMAFRVFRLADRPIRAFMTHRRDVVWLNTKDSFEKNWSVAMSAPHSFFPVCDETLDNVIGVVSVKDLCAMRNSSETVSLTDSTRDALRIPSVIDTLSLLEKFKRERRQMAIVVDQHGGVGGVITTHDILEALVGDLADYEGEESSITKRSDGTYLVDAGCDVQELLLLLDRAPNTGGKELSEFHSVGGVVFNLTGSVPHVGSMVTWNGLRLEVVDMDGYRIDKVLVSVEN